MDTKGFWEGQIGIKQRKYIDIKVPFDEVLEIRDDSMIFNKDSTSIETFLQLFTSVPAFVKYSQVHGREQWAQLERTFLENFLDILELPSDTDPSQVKLDTRHDYFLIMGRQQE